MKISVRAVIALSFFGLSFFGSVQSQDPDAPVFDAEVPDFDIDFESCVFAAADGSDIGDITCTFTAQGGTGHSITSAIKDDDCVSDLQAGSGVSLDPNPITTPVTPTTSTYSVTVSLANSAAPAGTTNIEFCLQTKVKGDDNNVYNWIGQKVKLAVNVNGQFSTTGALSTETFVGNQADAQNLGQIASYTVSAYRCDSDGDRASDTPLKLGENFYLCAEGSQSVLIDGIDTLKADKNGQPTLNLISAGGDRNSNTFVYGTGGNKVVIATRLPSNFYENAVGVSLSGTTDISIGGRRQLVRIMQEASPPESVDFSMEVGVVSSGAVSVSVFGAAAVLGAVAALLL